MENLPKFKGPTCKGSYAFGTACGHCDRERNRTVVNPVKRHKVRLDEARTLELLKGKPIALKIPEGCTVLELHPAALGLAPDLLRERQSLFDLIFGKKSL